MINREITNGNTAKNEINYVAPHVYNTQQNIIHSGRSAISPSAAAVPGNNYNLKKGANEINRNTGTPKSLSNNSKLNRNSNSFLQPNNVPNSSQSNANEYQIPISNLAQ